MKNFKLLAVALTLSVAHQQHGGGVYGNLNRGSMVSGGMEKEVAGEGEKKFEAEVATKSGLAEVDADSIWHLRKRHSSSQVDDFGSENAEVVSSLSNDVHEIFSKVREIASDDIDIDHGPEVLKVTANALSLLKDRISDPQVISSMPSDFQVLFKSLLREVSTAEKHVKTLENLAWEHYSVDKLDGDISKAKPRKRLLSNEESRLPLKFNSGVSAADYHVRATRRMAVHQSLAKDSDHQQGYHRARVHREGGGMNRRLNTESVCVDVDPEDRKKEQCIRLAACAKNYNLYDLFVFFFGDDIDFDTGSVDSKERISVEDESNLLGKLNMIKAWSKAIIDKDGELTHDELKVDGTCDVLLQEFHRFDEDLSVKGKWQGGSVTGVCRGWGTSNFMSLESVYFISDTVLNIPDRVENCLEALVDDFNREQFRFLVPSNPCYDTLLDPDGDEVEFYGSLTVGDVVRDIKNKFQCLQYSFLTKNNKYCPTSGNSLCLRAVTNAASESSGYVDIRVDSGNGYVTVNNPSKLYKNGTTVLDDVCFDTILGVQIRGPDTDAWAGSVEISLDSKTTFRHLTCDDCNGTTSDTTSIVVDGNSDGGTLATTRCLDGNVCNLEDHALPTVRCYPYTCHLFNPVFKAADIIGTFFNKPGRPLVFDFVIPAVLPSREDRVARTTPFYGTFLIDNAPLSDLTAEKFLVEVFNEYVGCATDLVRELGGDIFESSGSMYNPYAPNSNQAQFHVPLKISDDGADEHGQIMVDKLDLVFDYQRIGSVSQRLEWVEGTPQLSADLKDYLANVYFFDQLIDDMIKYYKDECPDDLETHCKQMLSILEPISSIFNDNGLDRRTLDTSIALIFGNKTTIGQVCSFARGLEDGIVDDVPGFCCLDAPYEAKDWGEKYACEKYIKLVDGSTKVVQKSKNDCNRVGPVTAGFNEAACDVFHGTWCPSPRNCSTLVTCINEAKAEVEESRDRAAFFEYLDEAPNLKKEEEDDPKKCGELREYFDYDRDYPDDNRICEEVLDLQCFTDFSNLDGFATGTAGPGASGGLAELAVSEKVKLITKVPFDGTAAKAWRSTNFALGKTLGLLSKVDKLMDKVLKACTTLISAFPGTSAPCTLPAVAAGISADIVFAIIQLALDISDRIYAEVVDAQNGRYAADRQISTYENVITNHGNILTTFYATQQLKVMLGEISEGLAADREEDEERRMLESCVSIAKGYIEGCADVACEDITRLCDGSFNFPYVASLKGAGCDDLDSDGDGKKDFCEDRFPPELVVRDAKIFRCNEDDTTQLCYNDKVFTSEKEVKNFLECEFPATDDCQGTEKLYVEIEKVDGTICGDTVFTLTPWQNISTACTGYQPNNPIFNEAFVNPLPGTPKQVTVQLDDTAPTVTCGFDDTASSNTYYDDQTQTLYHYMTVADESDHTLKDSNFFYSVTDDCDGEVDVDDIRIFVEFNEVEQNNITSLCTYEFDGSLQAMFSYAPTTCGNVDEDLFCMADPNNVRFYKISVIASDSAGNVGSTSCNVAIVPGCDESDPEPCEICEDPYCSQDYHYSKIHVDTAIANPANLFEVNFPYFANLEGAGCDNLDSDGDGKPDFCEDRFPPELVVRDAEIFRCNEDDTTQLCYDDKVFKSEKEAKNFLEYQFPVIDDCQPNENINVRMEKDPATTCGDTVFTLTPWQDISTCTGFVPTESYNDPFVNPLEGTPKQVTLSLDEEPPTVTCGFNSDDTSINVIVDKTLYHYMTKTDGPGIIFNDAKFFYEVNDDCDDDINIRMIVQSNEVQQNNIASLFQYEMDGFPSQVTFFYAPTTCGNVGQQVCKENPDNVRFYKISVIATDSAGNVASDSCTVVVISGCNQQQDGCLSYKTNGNPSAQNFYYDMTYVDDAVANSQGLFTVASSEFVPTVED